LVALDGAWWSRLIDQRPALTDNVCTFDPKRKSDLLVDIRLLTEYCSQISLPAFHFLVEKTKGLARSMVATTRGLWHSPVPLVSGQIPRNQIEYVANVEANMRDRFVLVLGTHLHYWGLLVSKLKKITAMSRAAVLMAVAGVMSSIQAGAQVTPQFDPIEYPNDRTQPTFPRSMSADGSTVVGGANDSIGGPSWVWQPGGPLTFPCAAPYAGCILTGVKAPGPTQLVGYFDGSSFFIDWEAGIGPYKQNCPRANTCTTGPRAPPFDRFKIAAWLALLSVAKTADLVDVDSVLIAALAAFAAFNSSLMLTILTTTRVLKPRRATIHFNMQNPN
jgi:hypothetical protein